MPLARRLSSNSKEAFSNFCDKNKPLSRRLSSNGSVASSTSTDHRRQSIAQDRGQRVLRRRNQKQKLSKFPSKSSVSKSTKDNVTSPEPKKRRTSVNKENNGIQNTNLMMSPTPYWKVSFYVSPRLNGSRDNIIFIFCSYSELI